MNIWSCSCLPSNWILTFSFNHQWLQSEVRWWCGGLTKLTVPLCGSVSQRCIFQSSAVSVASVSSQCRSAVLRKFRSLLFSVALCFCVVWHLKVFRLSEVLFPRTVVIAFRENTGEIKTDHSQWFFFFFLYRDLPITTGFYCRYFLSKISSDCLSMSQDFVVTFNSRGGIWK